MRCFYFSRVHHTTRSFLHNQARNSSASVLLVAALTTSSVAQASELPSFTEEDLIADIPLVVSATRRSQKLTEAPASITIIDREQIDASGAINIPDLFRLVPGIQAYHVTRNKFAVTYHGVSDDFPNRMEVMIDGRSIYLPLLSTVAWETIGIGMDDIDHIEVVRGSNVPTQGSNAFLGSINIVTRNALSPEQNSVQAMTGNRGERRVEFRHSVLGENGHIRLAGGYSQNDGSAIFKDDAHKSFLNLNATTSLSLRDTLDVRAGFSTGQYDVVGADDLEHTSVPRDHDSNYQHVVWSHVATDDSEFQFSFYHNYLKLHVDSIPIEQWILLQKLKIDLDGDGIDESIDTIEKASIVANYFRVTGTSRSPDSEHGRTDLYDLEAQYTYDPNESLSLVSGIGYRFERALSDMLLDSTDWISEEHIRLFSNLQWGLSHNTILNAGAMYEHSSLSSPKLSSRLALNYLLNDNTAIRVAHSRAYRIPSLSERHSASAIRMNEDNNFDIAVELVRKPKSLDPEQISSTELGFYSALPNYAIQFDARLFHEEISNGINTEFIPLDARYPYSETNNRIISKGNVQHWQTSGIEFQLKARPTDATLLALNYGYVDIHGQYYKKPIEIRNLHNYAPHDTVSVLASHTLNSGVQLSVAHYMMGTALWLEGSSRSQPRKAYQRTDLQLKAPFTLATDTDAEIRIIVQNLFDDRYQEFYDYNYFDRRAYVEVKLLF
jgi:iron complex outermembrane receptor protein